MSEREETEKIPEPSSATDVHDAAGGAPEADAEHDSDVSPVEAGEAVGQTNDGAADEATTTSSAAQAPDLPLIERLEKELVERRDELKPLVDEYEKLKRALDALTGV